jgi:hypothetical protein
VLLLGARPVQFFHRSGAICACPKGCAFLYTRACGIRVFDSFGVFDEEGEEDEERSGGGSGGARLCRFARESEDSGARPLGRHHLASRVRRPACQGPAAAKAEAAGPASAPWLG